jgi:hypothetical protein
LNQKSKKSHGGICYDDYFKKQNAEDGTESKKYSCKQVRRPDDRLAYRRPDCGSGGRNIHDAVSGFNHHYLEQHCHQDHRLAKLMAATPDIFTHGEVQADEQEAPRHMGKKFSPSAFQKAAFG